MANPRELMVSVLRSASSDGAVLPPKELLRVIANFDDLLRIESDVDQSNALFEAFDNQYGFVRQAIRMNIMPSPEEQETSISLIRWLVSEARQWKASDDPAYRMLTALLFVAQACDLDVELWSTLPDDLGSNSELVEELGNLISRLSVNFSSRPIGPELIWEKEVLAGFLLADQKGQWIEIEAKWKLLENVISPNFLFRGAVAYLYCYQFDYLVRVLESIRQTPLTMQVAEVLSVEQRLVLANASSNPYLQFSCAYQTLSGPHQLSARDENLLTELLLKIASEDERWSAWRQIFNYYPSRYPAIHSPLGRALAKAPEAAIRAYVESISLNAIPAKPEAGRRLVAKCLAAFRKDAILEQRQTLWKVAYERWLTWQFDQSTSGGLFEISWSALDYAIVGYAIECINNAERNNIVNKINNQAVMFDTIWHESLSACIIEWNRLLSQLQPYAFAANLSAGNEWLNETTTYEPNFASYRDYVKMLFEP